MANKRMFTRELVRSDAFMDMPISAQGLFFQLCMDADDDGFVSAPKGVARMCKAAQSDFELLKEKRYILSFPDSDVVLIKHWFLHNSIPKDRYTPTVYTEERSKVKLKCGKSYLNSGRNDNKAYTEAENVDFTLDTQPVTECKQTDTDNDTNCCVDKIRLDKKREDKNSSDSNSFFDAEKAWNDTFTLYPKKTSFSVAKSIWMDKILDVIEDNRKAVAGLIWHATKMYLQDYTEKNPNDTEYRYIPKYSDWLKEDCDYWIQQVEAERSGSS